MTKSELMNTVGKNLKKYRIENRLTQEQLAERVGISTSFCANLECGKKSMSILTLKELTNTLNVSADYLLCEESGANHMRNIIAILDKQSPEFIMSVEKIIRACVEEFSTKDA